MKKKKYFDIQTTDDVDRGFVIFKTLVTPLIKLFCIEGDDGSRDDESTRKKPPKRKKSKEKKYVIFKIFDPI